MADIATLKSQLIRCEKAITCGSDNGQNGIEWLNNFCGNLYKYTLRLHKYIGTKVEEDLNENQDMETILLCLAQICLCTKYLEQIIKAENLTNKTLLISRKHFIDRINWCFSRLKTALRNMTSNNDVKSNKNIMIGFPFMTLYDTVMDKLHAYSTYQDDGVNNIAEDNAQALLISNKVQSTLRVMISNTLALANVALIEDKKALSALCQKALRESNAFHQECITNSQQIDPNIWNRRLKAIAFETALTQLQQYVGETLCRLIFVSFMDLEKLSFDNFRAKLHQNTNDAELDEFIADFDVNLDRLTQIGHFCADIASSTKLKTFVRSVIASLEALDPCIIPSIQVCHREKLHPDYLHAEILEQHFCEETTKLKTAIFEAVGFKPFNNCFYEMLNLCVNQTEKEFNKSKLEDMVQMGEFLLQFCQYPNNEREFSNGKNCKQLEYYEKFKLMIYECHAILVCADQVDPKRIIKRFKILRAVMRKFIDTLNNNEAEETKKKNCDTKLLWIVGETHTVDINQSQLLSIDTIEPSICSILYSNESGFYKTRRQKINESMWGNNSKLSPTPLQNKESVILHSDEPQRQRKSLQIQSNGSGSSMRRKESLRRAMFKRQKSVEMKKACDFYLQNSTSLQISEILDQLTQISNSSDKENLINKSCLE